VPPDNSGTGRIPGARFARVQESRAFSKLKTHRLGPTTPAFKLPRPPSSRTVPSPSSRAQTPLPPHPNPPSTIVFLLHPTLFPSPVSFSGAMRGQGSPRSAVLRLFIALSFRNAPKSPSTANPCTSAPLSTSPIPDCKLKALPSAVACPTLLGPTSPLRSENPTHPVLALV
jgi:hypothetical protein